MKRSSITEAKNGLSALIERVRQGESVVIEDRGVPVAQLGPVAGQVSGADGDVIARLERQGIVRRPAAATSRKARLRAPVRPRRPVALSRLVRDERGEGW